MPDPAKTAVLLVPKIGAIVQYLGKYRSEYLLETDILPKSALLCRMSEDGSPKEEDADGLVRFSFEGNAIGYANVNNYREKAAVASGRLLRESASIAFGRAKIEDLIVVGQYDMERQVILSISNEQALSDWSGEDPEFTLPHQAMSGTRDPSELKRILMAGSCRTLICPPMVSRLANGQIYVQSEAGEMGHIYNPDDPHLNEALQLIRIPVDVRRDALRA